MSKTMMCEMIFFLSSVLTGGVLVWFYDVFRLLRRWIPHHIFVINIEDLCYWICSAFIIFGMIFKKNDGILRGYAFVGILVGVWIQSIFQKLWIKMLKKKKKRGRMTITQKNDRF